MMVLNCACGCSPSMKSSCAVARLARYSWASVVLGIADVDVMSGVSGC